jgi:nitrate/TMAO reductase-like tetraheme cytochrome c subunit
MGKSSTGTKKKRWLWLLGGVVVLFLLMAVAVHATSDSNFCGSCHEMEQYYESWTVSTHSDTDCISCHAEPTLAGLMKMKVNGLRQVAVHFSDPPTEIVANEAEIYCIYCHEDHPRTDTEAALAEKDPHSLLHFEEMTCLTCHRGLTHDVAVSLPDRRDCRTCHLNTMDLAPSP